jgi:hypothetical protein
MKMAGWILIKIEQQFHRLDPLGAFVVIVVVLSSVK